MFPLRLFTLAAVTTLCAITVAACGGSGHPSISAGASGQPPTRTLIADADKNATCMRSHGVTNFPDPVLDSQNGKQSLSIQLTPSIANSPAFKSAFKACAHLMPGTGGNLNTGLSAGQLRAGTAGAIAFARCMRGHGFTRFPDPNDQGQFTLAMIQGAGINLKEPALKPVADACTTVTHGVITKSDVAQAIANPDSLGTQAQTSAG